MYTFIVLFIWQPEPWELSKTIKHASTHFELCQSESKHSENKYHNAAYRTHSVQPPLSSQIWLHACSMLSPDCYLFWHTSILKIHTNKCKQRKTYNKEIWRPARITLQKEEEEKITHARLKMYLWTNTVYFWVIQQYILRTLQHSKQPLFFWICSFPPCRLTVPRQWASALLQGLQSRDTRQTGRQAGLVFRQSRQALQVCPVWHLKHLRSLLCRGRSDGPDRLSLLGASGPLSNLPGSVRGWDAIEELLARNSNYHGCLAFSSSTVFSTR